MRLRRGYALFALLAALSASAVAQGASPWTVKPDWVWAHEQFLASDVLQGRGSATRDEEIAATYVASEFRGYGLEPAPGMTGYLQSAEVVSPVLDGKATLTVGDLVLREGADFQMLTSSGVWVKGRLQRVDAARKGAASSARVAVLLLTELSRAHCADCQSSGGLTTVQEMSEFRRSGAALLIGLEDDSTRQMAIMMGGKTRLPIGLKDAPPRPGRVTTIVVSRAAMDRLLAQKDGAKVALEVHELPATAPRRTFNAIGYLPGTDPTSGTVLLTSHLDHLGIGSPVNGDAIYNGANDDAAGTTAVLELAHALAAGPRLKRSVLFVCYGSEEAGDLGSTYFGEHPPVPLNDLVANLEFEMIGAQDPKMPRGVLLLTGWDRSNLGPTLRAHGALLGPDPYPEQHFFERSDNYALALKGVVAHTAAGWGTVPTYHQPDDDLAHLDVPFMTAAIQSLIEPIRWLADSGFKPQWVPGGQPKSRE